jgi:hypothetical protein
MSQFKVGDRIQFTPATLATCNCDPAITQAESQGTIRRIEEGDRRKLLIEFDDGSVEWWLESLGFEPIPES